MGNTHTTSRRAVRKTNGSEGTLDCPGHVPNLSLASLPPIWQADPPALSEDQRQQMHAALQECGQSRIIQLSGLNLATLPAWLSLASDAASIKEIVLSKNCLRDFPEPILRFRHLERLSLGSNQIGVVPDAICELKSLVWLDFTHNRISHVSDRLGELPHLASLGASDCRLMSFPLAFTRLRRLRKLGVFNNLITELPPEIGKMRALTKLDLSGNNLTTLPVEIGHLQSLSWLNVSNNKIRTLPAELGNLTAMRELGLAHNHLAAIPDLSRMKELTLLTAFNNQLEHIGDWISQLRSLAKLDLSGNQLRALPAGILTLPNLELLNVRGNRIMEIPAPDPRNLLVKPNNLTVLDFRDNELASLPISVLCAQLRELKCTGNQFYRGSLERRVAVPSMRLLYAALLAREYLPGRRSQILKALSPVLRVAAVDLWEGRVGFRCQHCQCVFTHQPVRHLDVRETSDEPGVPFLVLLCSARCRAAYLRNSSSSHTSALSYHHHQQQQQHAGSNNTH